MANTKCFLALFLLIIADVSTFSGISETIPDAACGKRMSARSWFVIGRASIADTSGLPNGSQLARNQAALSQHPHQLVRGSLLEALGYFFKKRLQPTMSLAAAPRPRPAF